jgi:hypothetical protein
MGDWIGVLCGCRVECGGVVTGVWGATGAVETNCGATEMPRGRARSCANRKQCAAGGWLKQLYDVKAGRGTWCAGVRPRLNRDVIARTATTRRPRLRRDWRAGVGRVPWLSAPSVHWFHGQIRVEGTGSLGSHGGVGLGSLNTQTCAHGRDAVNKGEKRQDTAILSALCPLPSALCPLPSAPQHQATLAVGRITRLSRLIKADPADSPKQTQQFWLGRDKGQAGDVMPRSSAGSQPHWTPQPHSIDRQHQRQREHVAHESATQLRQRHKSFTAITRASLPALSQTPGVDSW